MSELPLLRTRTQSFGEEKPVSKNKLSTILIILVLYFHSVDARAENRWAFVVGNDQYVNLSGDKQLRRAVNDARGMSAALEKIGFKVIRGENLTRQTFNNKFDEMARSINPGDVAFFFFAGHGVTIDRENYILPSDVPDVADGQESKLARASFSEQEIISELQRRGARVSVVILDACRSNPFKKEGVRAVGGERGLARTAPVRGSFSLYSAAYGQVAHDRLGSDDRDQNSVFTRVLIPALGKPGLDLATLAIEVREQVANLAASANFDQRPAYYDETTGGRFYLAGPPPKAEISDELAWRFVNQADAAALRRYLAEFPFSPHARTAERLIVALAVENPGSSSLVSRPDTGLPAVSNAPGAIVRSKLDGGKRFRLSEIGTLEGTLPAKDDCEKIGRRYAEKLRQEGGEAVRFWVTMGKEDIGYCQRVEERWFVEYFDRSTQDAFILNLNQ